MSAPPPPPGQRSAGTTTIVIAVVLVLVLAITGAGLAGEAAWTYFRDGDDGGDGSRAAPPKPSSTAEPNSNDADLERFYDQDLNWRSCGVNSCALLTVPLDYAEPAGETITLAVLRAPASRRGERVGQLVVNPGGPGASGVQYAASGSRTFGDELTSYFDIVGFDPRGVGKSTPLECADTKLTDEFVSIDPDPDTPAEASQFDRITREFGEGCLAGSGALTRHISTVEAVKDIDILRAALGERQLDFFGASYGTLLGATYADLFPGNVRRMVLDGALDPTLTLEALNLEQARGFQTALDAYLKYCIDEGECVLGDTVPAASRRIGQLLDQLDAQPLPTSSGRELTEGLARYGILLPLYLRSYWPLLTLALTQAIENGAGDQLLFLSDQYSSRGPDRYKDNSIAAYNAVTCLDYADRVPPDQVTNRLRGFADASPVFGRSFGYDFAKCSSWPVKSTRTPRPINAPGAPPIVVIGTTRDPATPYALAKALAGQLESGVLVSRDGDGHTGFRQGNKCVDRAIEGFLLGGTVPEDGLSC